MIVQAHESQQCAINEESCITRSHPYFYKFYFNIPLGDRVLDNPEVSRPNLVRTSILSTPSINTYGVSIPGRFLWMIILLNI